MMVALTSEIRVYLELQGCKERDERQQLISHRPNLSCYQQAILVVTYVLEMSRRSLAWTSNIDQSL